MGALRDLRNAHPKQTHLLDPGEPVGLAHPLTAFVLIPLRDEPVHIGGALRVHDRRERLPGLRCGQRAAFACHDHRGVAVEVGQHRDEHALGPDRLDEPGVSSHRVGVAGAHVRADGDGRGVEVVQRACGATLLSWLVCLGSHHCLPCHYCQRYWHWWWCGLATISRPSGASRGWATVSEPGMQPAGRVRWSGREEISRRRRR